MMLSRSGATFLDFTSGELPSIPQTPRALPRLMAVPGIISDSYGGNDGDLDSTSSVSRERKIIVANMLPLHARRDSETAKWSFNFDQDSLLLQLKDGFSPDTEVIFVGSLKVEVEASEQEEVAQRLLDEYKCLPTFLPLDILKKFYHGFCKQQLWPCPDHGDRFDRQLWQAYVCANKLFADKVMEVVNPDDDYIWVHDYHLMVLPTFLRKRYHRVKVGFFLHSPLPSKPVIVMLCRYPKAIEIYEDIARQSLNNNLLKYGVKGHLLNAGICQLCKGDVVAINNALERYQELDPTFSGTREYRLLADLASAIDEEDVAKFTDAVKEYDSWMHGKLVFF